ncbi:DUF3429 domain-containing protein [Alteromonas flava]|uniref:DUF3429 domain-containing protein n=1 Tax=Alteromonas flava TaxID=2048003 RepID=UPI000C290E97|nr:DUF3429 domain-containing protein [Alteromonas flava]
MPNNAKLLGYLGLIPFLIIPLAIIMETLSYAQGFAFFTQYSAIILSFLGGIHWYAAVTENRYWHQIYVAMLPSIVGWLALILFPDARALGVLSLSFIGMVFYDKFTLQMTPSMIIDYTRLRVILTTIVVAAHAVMIFVV